MSISRYAIAALMVLVGHVQAAEIVISDAKCPWVYTRLLGEIAPGDAARLQSIVNQIKRRAGTQECPEVSRITLLIASEGGDVDEAMALGEIIRKEEFEVSVMSQARCVSSCVLVLAAGVERTSYGAVGIHRPYFVDLPASATSAEVRRSRDALSQRIRVYLSKMDVSPQLFDAMEAVPPRQMRMLSEAELQGYRLLGRDATHDERSVAKMAEFFGTTSAEYRRRDALADARCPPRSNPSSFDCRTAFRIGISPAELAARNQRVQEQCNQPSAEARGECALRIRLGR